MMRIAPLKAFGLACLIAVNVWLLTMLTGEIGSEASTVPGKLEWSPDLPVAGEGPAARKPIGAYRETLARPIFFKTRQPYVPPPPPTAPQPVAVSTPVIDPGFVLGGVIIDRALKKAYLFTKADARGTWASEGEKVLGWTVQSVGVTGVRLQQQGRTIEVLLYPRD